jgi:hypothetical protein
MQSQVEDIKLSEVSQIQKDKGCMFSLIYGRQIQKINIYTKNKHDHIQKYMQNMFVIVEQHLGTWGRKERKRE